jgi:uncharacterized protein
MNMPKVIPVPDELSKPFWEAVNQKRLVVQRCTACNTLQYPPRPKCQDCQSESLDWKEVGGKGHILAAVSIEDSHIPPRAVDQPFPLALVTLDEDPRINFFSNLPGSGIPSHDVPAGAAVEVMFEELPDGSLIHEWRLV